MDEKEIAAIPGIRRRALLYFVECPAVIPKIRHLASGIPTKKMREACPHVAQEMFWRMKLLVTKGIDLIVVYHPPRKEEEVKRWLPFERAFYWPQEGRSARTRMDAAFRRAWREGYRSIVAVTGGGSLRIEVERVEGAFALLTEYDLVIGPVRGGGFYLMGLSGKEFSCLKGVRWNPPWVLKSLLETACREKLSYYLLGDLENPSGPVRR